MTGQYILDENREPMLEPDVLKWARWFETADRVVKRDEVGNVTISTVFLGLDHGWNSTAPMLYETLIFGGKHDGEMHRYATREEALEGHAGAVALVEEG